MEAKLVVGIILLIVGVVFLFNSKKIGEGAFGFYRMIYTRKNLRIMFRVAGVILAVGGLVLIVL